MTYIVTVSPKGQITIPVAERKNCKHNKYLLEVKGKTIILKPITIKIMDEHAAFDEVKEFSSLAESNFTFWNNDQDDVYQKFYADKKSL